MRSRSRRTARAALTTAIVAIGLAAVLAGCGGSSDSTTSSAGSGSASNAAATSGAGSAQLQLVAYSTPKKAYDALIAAFAQTSAGKGVSFGQSFGASGLPEPRRRHRASPPTWSRSRRRPT